MNIWLKGLISACLLLLSLGCGSNDCQPPQTGDKPTISLGASIPVENSDGSYNSTLTWQTTNAVEVSISGYPAVSAASGSGSQEVILVEPTTRYAALASGPGGTATTEIAITIPIPGIPKPIPAIPASISGTVIGSGTVQITWSSVLSPMGGDVGMSYDVYMDGVLRQASAVSPLIIGSLINGVSYSFTVRAVFTNESGTAFASAPSVAVVLTPMVEVKEISITVAWDAVTTYADGSPIAPVDVARIIYTIFSNTTGDVPWGSPRAVSMAGATSVEFLMTVTAGTQYYFTATASLDGQVSAYAVAISHTWNEPLP